MSAADSDLQLPSSTILIVDDVPQNVELLQAYLESTNCVTHAAYDGVEALEKVKKVKPDLIILDIMMPRMSGFEVCRRLKEDPATRDVPVIMVTALNEMGDIERAVANGTDDYLTKPVNKQDLVGRVKSLLRVRPVKGGMERTIAYLSDLEGKQGG